MSLSNKEAGQVLAQALASVQLQAQRDMAEKMIDVCFQRCVSAPEERLTDKQRKCLDACASCFVEGYQLASETLMSIAKKPAAGRD